MDLLELIAGVQEDVENAPVETVRWEPPEHGTSMRELAFEFHRLTGLDLGLQTRILADTLSGAFEKAPSWCWDYLYKQASCVLYSWLDKNGGTSIPNNRIVDKLLIDCLRGVRRASILTVVQAVSIVVRDYVVKRGEEEKRQNDIALMAT